jgi:hypothetical protein
MEFPNTESGSPCNRHIRVEAALLSALPQNRVGATELAPRPVKVKPAKSWETAAFREWKSFPSYGAIGKGGTEHGHPKFNTPPNVLISRQPNGWTDDIG